MNFQQLTAMIPVFEHVQSSSVSQALGCPANSCMIIVVRRGHVTIVAGGREPIIVTQGFTCHSGHNPIEIQVPRTKEAEYVVITYRVLPESTDWTLYGPLRTHSEVKIHYMLDELIRTEGEIHPRSADEEALQQFRKRMILERILFIFLYETHMRQEEPSSAISIEETISYINEHYMLKLTLPLLAQRAGISEGHYTVLFKKHTGMTMTHYLRHLRIEKAKQMFQQTRLPAKEIALRVGFVDYFHFSRVFKAEVGCSPTAYQQGLAEI